MPPTTSPDSRPLVPGSAPLPQPSRWNRARWFGLLMIAAGIAGWWYNRHLAATTGEFYIRLCIFGPLGVFGGLLMALRPEWAGPLRPESTRAHKLALAGVLGLMFVASGIEMFRLKQMRRPRPSVIACSPAMGKPQGLKIPSLGVTPALAAAPSPAVPGVPSIDFLARTYRLGSFNQQRNATWEFVTGGESVQDWKTLLTVIDRPDARTREELDRLAEGIMETYRSHGAQILLAKTMRDDSGAPFNYLVAAFEEPAKRRYELNFVKVTLAKRNAAVVIYGARVGDPGDYRTKAKDFLNRSSSEIGFALGRLAVPEIAELPREVF